MVVWKNMMMGIGNSISFGGWDDDGNGWLNLESGECEGEFLI
jgi:hypothetical protein